MGSEIKIPTLFGLGVLLVGLIAGVFLVTQGQIFKTQATPATPPQKINVANITNTSASIYWQTNEATPGFIQTGLTSSLDQTFRDVRDPSLPKPHRLHFVTLTNLNPETTYYYKINSGTTLYPTGTPLSFKTAAPAVQSSNPPIIGTIISSASQPIEEALVTLETDAEQKIATITKALGNFVLPLINLPNIQEGGKAALIVFDWQKSSRIALTLSASSPTMLPPITLGQDLDLTAPTASPSSSPPQYDLNRDGVVNSLDLSIIYKNFGPLREASKNPKQKEADLNHDGVVDQKDVNLITPFIPHVAPAK